MPKTVLRAIGLMSGTSMDGVDVALIETDGERIAGFGPTGYRAYADGERAVLRQAIGDAATLTDRAARPGVLAQAEALVTQAHAQAVSAFLRDNAIAADTVDIVGFHGQTVLHRPDKQMTVQIGDGEQLALLLGLPVAYDLRAADMAAGGQGAPLVPVYHRALAASLDRPSPLLVVNIGGVANITFIEAASAEPVACDTGPGNAPLDDYLRARTGQAFDDGGAVAARGKVDEAFVARVLARPFFAAPPPKSLDRQDFALAALGLPQMSVENGAATLTALTAASIAAVLRHLPASPQTVIVAGGGAMNATLMRMLAQRLAPARVETANDVGWSAEAVEAQGFAYLAVRSLRGLPLTFPGTTGVPQPTTGGVLAQPGKPAARPAPLDRLGQIREA